MDEYSELLDTGAYCQVVAVTTAHGCPLRAFLEELDQSAPQRSRKAWYWIKRLAEFGPPTQVDKGHPIHQERNLYVLKPDRQVRIVYFRDDGANLRRVVITHGFFKTKQDIPPNEKDRALNARARYWEGKRGDR